MDNTLNHFTLPSPKLQLIAWITFTQISIQPLMIPLFGVITRTMSTQQKVVILGFYPPQKQQTLLLRVICGLGFGNYRYRRNINSLFGWQSMTRFNLFLWCIIETSSRLQFVVDAVKRMNSSCIVFGTANFRNQSGSTLDSRTQTSSPPTIRTSC